MRAVSITAASNITAAYGRLRGASRTKCVSGRDLYNSIANGCKGSLICEMNRRNMICRARRARSTILEHNKPRAFLGALVQRSGRSKLCTTDRHEMCPHVIRTG